jgi:hypothetical protein
MKFLRRHWPTIVFILVSIVVALIMTSCGGDGGQITKVEQRELQVSQVLVNGRMVTCVVYKDAYYEQGGISCDWERGGNQ